MSAMVGTGHAQLIANGSFESPALNSDGLFWDEVPASWSLVGRGIMIRGQPFPQWWPAPYDGAQCLDIGWSPAAQNEYSQQVQILTPGLHELGWVHTTGTGQGIMTHTVALRDSLGGTVVSGTFQSMYGAWGASSLSAFLPAGTYTVVLASGVGGAYDTLIDAVALTLVPELHEYALLAGLGLVGFALWRRRNAK